MPMKNFVISFLIIASTFVGGTCFFGFCASADSGYIAEPVAGLNTSADIADIAEASDRDVPIAEAVINEDGKLEGRVLTINKPEIDFGQDFDLAKNQKKLIEKPDVKTVTKAAAPKAQTAKAVAFYEPAKSADAEMAAVLADIKKQEQEVRNLLAELKDMKANRSSENRVIEDVAQKSDTEKTDTNVVAAASATDVFADEDAAPKLNIAKTPAVQTEEKKDTVLMAMKGGNIVPKKETATEKIAAKNQKKFQPMIVESTKKKSVSDTNFDMGFKDYSGDNSGRNGEYITNEDDAAPGSFEKAFSALRPDKSKTAPKNIVAERRKKAGAVGHEVSRESVKKFRNAYLSSDDVKRDFYNTYITENRYLSPFEDDDEDGEATAKSGNMNYDILQLKIEFQENSTALSATDVNILRYFVYTAQNDPTKGVQITIGQDNMSDVNRKKLTARRLAIVNAIFKEEGLSEKQIIPVLTDRDMESFAFSIIPVDEIENYRKGGVEKDMFGDTIGNSQTFRTMKW